MNIDIIYNPESHNVTCRRIDGVIVDSFEVPEPEEIVSHINDLTKLRLTALNSVYKRKFIPLFDLYENIWIIGVLDHHYDPTRYKVRSWDKFKSLMNTLRDLKRLNKTDTYEEPSICKKCGKVFIISKKESEFYSSRKLPNPLTCFECRGADNVQAPRTLQDYHQEEHDLYIELEELNDEFTNEFYPIFTDETYTTKIG